VISNQLAAKIVASCSVLAVCREFLGFHSRTIQEIVLKEEPVEHHKTNSTILRTQKIAKAEGKNESSWNLCERIGESSSFMYCAMHCKLLGQLPL
jgi:hypothetical protein